MEGARICLQVAPAAGPRPTGMRCAAAGDVGRRRAGAHAEAAESIPCQQETPQSRMVTEALEPEPRESTDVPRRLASASDIERRRADEPAAPEDAEDGIPGEDEAPRLGAHRAGLPARGEDAGPGRRLTDPPHLQSKRQGRPRTSPAHAKGGVDMVPADSLQSPNATRRSRATSSRRSSRLS
jgi:hypothetical protein